MTVEAFIGILAFCSAISSLLTEAVKKSVGEKYNLQWNTVVLCISMLTGILVVGMYYGTIGAPITMMNMSYLFLMGLANWVCAMVGYDKVKQTIEQFKH